MIEQKFASQINRLVETFGKAPYGNERVKLVWMGIRDLPDDWFERTVTEMISSQRQAPLVPDFIEAARTERFKAHEQIKKTHTNPLGDAIRCTYCKDTGCFVCVKPGAEDLGYWAFRCACQRGQNDPRTQIPFFTSNHQNEGYVFFDAQRRA